MDFNPFRIEATPAAGAQAPAPASGAAPADPAAGRRRAVEDLERRKKLLERLQEIEGMLRGLREEL